MIETGFFVDMPVRRIMAKSDKKLFAKISSLMLAMIMCVIACATTPVYAAECDVDEAENIEQEEMTTRAATSTNLAYGAIRNVIDPQVLGDRNYVKIATVNLPNDDRIHRILFATLYNRASEDQGIGNINLKVKMTRNGVKIYEKEFKFEETNGIIDQAEVLNVSKNQSIDIWIDTASAGASNGNFRKIFMSFFNVYTD